MSSGNRLANSNSPCGLVRCEPRREPSDHKDTLTPSSPGSAPSQTPLELASNHTVSWIELEFAGFEERFTGATHGATPSVRFDDGKSPDPVPVLAGITVLHFHSVTPENACEIRQRPKVPQTQPDENEEPRSQAAFAQNFYDLVTEPSNEEIAR